MAERALAEPGLLLIAHGSPSAAWNGPVLDLGRRVADEAARGGTFKAVRTAMLEAVQPDVPTAVAELEAEGCDRIVAVPLFIAPSGHTHFDVPAVLGIYASPRTTNLLAQEGARIARPKVPITLVETLSEGEVLSAFVVDEVRKLSRSPKDEALVVLAHGDPEHHLLVDRLLRQIVTGCCGATGVAQGDWAFIGVGQEYLANGVPAIKAAAEGKKRVLVVGLYLSTSAAKLHRRALAMTHHREPGQDPGHDPLQGHDVVFSEGAVIDHPSLIPWILASAQAALDPSLPRKTAGDK
jgi:sirohydrochlorin ferrochelatase